MHLTPAPPQREPLCSSSAREAMSDYGRDHRGAASSRSPTAPSPHVLHLTPSPLQTTASDRMVEAAAAITQTVIGGRATGASIETAAIIIEDQAETIGLGVMREEEEDGRSGRVVMTVGREKTGAGAATESETTTRAETTAATGAALAGKGMVGVVAAEAAGMKTTVAQAAVFRPRTRSSTPTFTSCCISQCDTDIHYSRSSFVTSTRPLTTTLC